MSPEEPGVRSFQLKGHQGPVLCLDHSSSRLLQQQQQHGDWKRPSSFSYDSQAVTASLLSGSEDGTCRVWDLREALSCRASLCIKCPGHVLSVAFGPSSTLLYQSEQQQQPPQEDDASPPLSALHSAFAREYSVYTAVGNSVYGYDLRYAVSPIITEPTDDCSFLDAQDEVNQIAFSLSIIPQYPHVNRQQQISTGRQRRQRRRHRQPANDISYLAAADDAGTVRITDLIGSSRGPTNNIERRKQVLHHGTDESPALVTTLSFCPRINNNNNNKQILLASGGTDCCIHLWDILNPSRAVASVLLPPLTESSTTTFCNNPPLVHSLACSPSGRLLAAGLGDGSVALLPVPTLTVTARLADAHAGAVAACLFPAFTRTSRSSGNSSGITNAATHTASAHDRLLCTVGNDGNIVLWDLGLVVCGDQATDPADVLQLPPSTTTTNTATTAAAAAAPPVFFGRKTRSSDPDDEEHQPRTLFAIPHAHHKPNWMVSSRGRDPVFPSSIFVADTSPDITVYTLPLQ